MDASVNFTPHSQLYSSIDIDYNDFENWDNLMVCKWLSDTKRFKNEIIEIFKESDIIGTELNVLANDHSFLKGFGIDLRNILSFVAQYNKLCDNKNNNYKNNNNNYNKIINKQQNTNDHTFFNNTTTTTTNTKNNNSKHKDINKDKDQLKRLELLNINNDDDNNGIKNNKIKTNCNKTNNNTKNNKIDYNNLQTIVPYKRIDQAPIIDLNQFELVEKIGEGAFSIVEKYRMKNSPNQYIAIKKISILLFKQIEEKIIHEINVLYSLNHPNIIKINGYFKDESFYYISMPYYKNGSIKNELNNKYSTRMNEKEIKEFSKKLLQAIQYLHNLNDPIIHRDIKGDNVLIDDNGDPVLADFGLCYQANNEDTRFKTTCGTDIYKAPEIINSNKPQYGRKCDIWSFGCTVKEMLVRGDPWEGKFKENKSPPIPNSVSDECKEFLNRCFVLDPNYRPSANKLLNDDWFKTSLNYIKIDSNIQEEILKQFSERGATLHFNFISTPIYYDRLLYLRIKSGQLLHNPLRDEDKSLIQLIDGNKEKIQKDLKIFITVGDFYLDLTKEFPEEFEKKKDVFRSLAIIYHREFPSLNIEINCAKAFFKLIEISFFYPALINDAQRFQILPQ